MGHAAPGSMGVCWRLLLASLSWVSLFSCAPAPGQPRGFGSQQVLAIRDPLLSLRAFSEDGSQVYLARVLPDRGRLSGILPYDRSLLTLGSGVETPIQEAVLTAGFLAGDGVRPRLLVLLHFASASDALDARGLFAANGPRLLLSLADETTGERQTLSDIASFPLLGATRAHPMAVARFDGVGLAVSTWMGLPEDLRPIAPADILGVDETGAFVHPNDPQHLAEPVVAHLPMDGSPMRQVVPFRLGEYVALAGHAPDPLDPGGTASPVGAPLGPRADRSYRCAREPDGTIGRCFLLHSRRRSADWVSYFARFVDDPVELSLPGLQPRNPLATVEVPPPVGSPSQRALVWLAVTGGAPRLFSWKVGAAAASSCLTGDAAVRRIAWTADEELFAAVTVSANLTGTGHGSSHTWTLMVSAPGADCRQLASSGDLAVGATSSIDELVFSPDGKLLARLETAADGTSSIKVSAVDGSEEHLVASGAVFSSISFVGNNRLQLLRRSPEGAGLSWVDPALTSAPEHPLAERVANLGSATWLNSRWLLLGHSYSEQDDTFTLSAIDAESGERRNISTAVTDFRVPWTTPPPNTVEVPVAYIVRGRISSAQDGIWLAQLPLADFPDER